MPRNVLKNTVILVVKGAQLPDLPGEIGRVVQIRKLNSPTIISDDLPVKNYDVYEVIGAKVGFSGNEILRLSVYNLEEPLKWVKNNRLVYGYAVDGKIRFNRLLCFECGKLSGKRSNPYYNKKQRLVITEYCCDRCHNKWEFSKKPKQKIVPKEQRLKNGHERENRPRRDFRTPLYFQQAIHKPA